MNRSIGAIDYRPKKDWLRFVKNYWFDGEWEDECAAEEPASKFWLDG